MARLPDGTEISERRLGRVFQYDPRIRDFPIRPTIPIGEPAVSMTWLLTAYLDQGNEGSCVGHAVAHEALTRVDIRGRISHEVAVQIYKRAQQLDPWPGEDYDGTSVLAGLKTGFEMGFYLDYRWALNFSDLIMGVGHHGPAIIGINWYDQMFGVDSNHFIHVGGNIAGGHALLVTGVSIPKRKFRIHNSWGKGWGLNGDAFISFEDMERLFNEQGEAAFPGPKPRPGVLPITVKAIL